MVYSRSFPAILGSNFDSLSFLNRACRVVCNRDLRASSHSQLIMHTYKEIKDLSRLHRTRTHEYRIVRIMQPNSSEERFDWFDEVTPCQNGKPYCDREQRMKDVAHRTAKPNRQTDDVRVLDGPSKHVDKVDIVEKIWTVGHSAHVGSTTSRGVRSEFAIAKQTSMPMHMNSIVNVRSDLWHGG